MGPDEVADLFGFSEAECLDALLSPDTLASAEALLRTWLEKPPRRLVLGGAGTSGRLAWHLARRFREPLALMGVEIRAWIAGGSRALVLAVEGAEDDFDTAHAELAALVDGDDGFFLGISCGLSAPCVAAGVVAALDLGGRAAVFGVNAADEARSAPLRDLAGGFRGLLSDLAADVRFTLVSCPVGPELLTGSSRLKGGTATWVLLEALLGAWVEPDERGLSGRIRETMAQANGIVAGSGPWIEAAGECLRKGGSLFYLGQGIEGTAALLDASECGPTFGASPEQIRAFVAGGWGSLGVDAARGLPLLSLECFDRVHAGSLREQDLVFLLGGLERQLPAPTVSLPVRGFLPTKLLLNAISTGAFVRAGKVWGNRMIDLALSNHKLFDRACRILEDLRGKPADACYRSLVAAIWGEDRPERDLLRLPAEAHLAQVRAQGGACGYVPLAMLHLEGMELAAGRRALAKEPLIRNLLAH